MQMLARRLSHIHQNTRSSKVYSSALSAGKIAEFIPSETAALAARLYTRTRLGERHRPFFNLVITNVPGPQIPLYMGGGYVSEHLGTAPLIDGMGPDAGHLQLCRNAIDRHHILS